MCLQVHSFCYAGCCCATLCCRTRAWSTRTWPLRHLLPSTSAAPTPAWCWMAAQSPPPVAIWPSLQPGWAGSVRVTWCRSVGGHGPRGERLCVCHCMPRAVWVGVRWGPQCAPSLLLCVGWGGGGGGARWGPQRAPFLCVCVAGAGDSQWMHDVAIYSGAGVGPGPWTLDPGPWTLGSEPWTLDPGPWDCIG